jgi:hypothetical protein
MIEVLHILLRVPPAVCGIGDYSWQMARVMQKNHEVNTSFLCVAHQAVPWPEHPEFPVARLTEQSSKALLQYLDQNQNRYDALVFHISLYGFQKRGVPFWLARAFKDIARRPGHPPIVAMFHELYASSSWKNSSYWVQPLQKMILRVLARSADGLRTNRQPYADWLMAVSGRKASSVTVMPVFSTLGEMDHPPGLAERPASMVMFASGIHGGGNEQDAIQRAVTLCKKLQLTKLHLVGGQKPANSAMDDVTLDHQAFIPTENAGALLSQCRVAYTGYHPLYFGKSTILAAFAAHGLAVITRGEQPVLPDGLREDREVLHEAGVLLGTTPSLEKLQGISDGLQSWYADHTLAKNAESYASQIKQLTGSRLVA